MYRPTFATLVRRPWTFDPRTWLLGLLPCPVWQKSTTAHIQLS